MLDTLSATDQETTNDLESVEDQTSELVTDSEESQSDEIETPNEDGGESFVYELDGEEITSEQIREWKDGNLRLSDYTRKTQDVAKERKAAEAARKKAETSISKIDAIISELDALINADLEVDWDDLRETDTAEYLRLKDLQKDRQEARQKALDQKKAINEELIQEEQAKLVDALGWNDPEKGEEKKKKDLNLFTSATKDIDVSNITDHRLLTLILDGARFREVMAKKPSVSKKVVKAPKVTKPGGQKAEQPKSLAQRMYGT